MICLADALPKVPIGRPVIFLNKKCMSNNSFIPQTKPLTLQDKNYFGNTKRNLTKKTVLSEKQGACRSI